MSVVAIVPARGGSKSIKLKAIAKVNGRPLIFYNLYELLNTPEIDKVIVSTDNEIIKNTVKDLFLNEVDVIDRPAEFATDLATSESVIEHALKVIKEKYDYTIMSQCTSPLTEASDFTNLIKSCKDSAGFYTECYDYFHDFKDDVEALRQPRQPRQLKTPRKKEAGNAWMFDSLKFLKYKTRLFENIGLCKISFKKNIEIDEPDDLILIENIMKGD